MKKNTKIQNLGTPQDDTLVTRREFMGENVRWAAATVIGSALWPIKSFAAFNTGAFFRSSVVRRPGTLWGAGDDGNAQLGQGGVFTGHKSTPVQIGSATNWVQVGAGDYFTHAIKTDGTLWGSGQNNNGQVGVNSAVNPISSPVQLGSLKTWQQVRGGYTHSIALKKDGTLWGWGNNSYGQLADGTRTNRSSPVQAGAATNWKIASPGFYHTMAIKKDGTLWAWGSNGFGELGLGNTIGRSSPVQVGSGTNWLTVAASNGLSAAIKTDGTLWTWGASTAGALGNSSVTPRSSPVQVGALTTWNRIEGRNETFAAMKTDGTVWVWGSNSDGQLGDGTRTNRSSPIQFGTSSWADFSVGNTFIAAIKKDGTLWTSGANDNGQLGIGTTAAKSSPVQVGSLTDWVSISSGGFFFVGIKTS